MKSKFTSKCFTLVEIMIVSSIALMIMTAILGMIYQTTMTFRDSNADAVLNSQGALLRTKILRGIADSPGLRSAQWSSISDSTTEIDFKVASSQNEWPSAVENNVSMSIGKYKDMLKSSSDSDITDLLRSGSEIKVSDFSIETSPKSNAPTTTASTLGEILDANLNRVVIRVQLQLKTGSRTYHKELLIKTAIRNN